VAAAASGSLDTAATPEGPVVASLVGEHDLRTKRRLLDQLTSLADGGPLVIDLSRATFIDSSVLHALVETDRAATLNGTSVVIQVGPDQPARKVLEASGLLRHLASAPTREEAIELALRPPRQV
jgi:anti-sigma B factor antagonist